MGSGHSRAPTTCFDTGTTAVYRSVRAQIVTGSSLNGFVSALGKGLGVPSVSVDTAEALVHALRQSFAEPGPMLIEAVLGGA